MTIAGIIAEYNPFHNGHAWHVRRTRELTNSDYVIACIDGHFTQRGEPACLSKWARVRMALSCGVDAVLELPALFAVRPADAFARGGVSILGGVGVDVLSFGCETDDLSLPRALAALRSEEPVALSRRIREKLEEGKSHARARGEAVGEWLGVSAEEVNRPNLVLAAEYLRAIDELFPGMQAVAVRRRGDYHDECLGEFASASAIRAAYGRGEADAAARCIPEPARPFAVPDALHPMDDLLLYRLRAMSLSDLAALPDVSEGLERRLYRLCRGTSGREALLDALKCKRYTRARLSRLLTHALLDMKQTDVEKYRVPPYARLLGIRQGAEALAGELKRRATLPIVSSARELRGDPCFELECRSTDAWALLHDAPEGRLPGREYTEGFVRV